jgi:hypothetical protein
VVIENELAEASSTTDGTDSWYVYSYGGGLCFLDSNSALSGVDVYENFADQGGGIYVDEDSILTVGQAWLTANTATDGAGLEVDGGEITLTNIGSTWNQATDDGGGLLAIDATVSLVNVTHGYDEGSSSVLYFSGSSAGSLLNTIVACGGVGILGDSGASLDAEYNNVYCGTAFSGFSDPTGSDGNIASDPEFTSVSDDGAPYNDDWTLSTGSPSIDAGDPDSAYTDTDGSTNDQGAFGGPEGDWDS